MRLMIACRAIDNMAGGVERQALALANEMSNRGHNVCLLTLDHSEATAFYPIEETVTWYKLNMGDSGVKASWLLRFQRMKRVREILSKFNPGVCLAFQDGMFMALRAYTLGMGVPVVASERESPFRFDYINVGKYRSLIYQAMRFASYITVQCDSYTSAYPKFLRHKITVIPNAITQQANAKIKIKQKTKTLLCVGRLGYQKNQLLLVKVFARLSPLFPDWKLVFVGEGDGREKLEAAISNYSLWDKVEVLGAVKNVSDYYLSSDVLCIPSRWEGFPNVLGEALAHSLPVVGFEGCGGVRDLIVNDQNGLLASGNDNANSLYKSLDDIMGNDQKRNRLRGHAQASVAKYDPSRVYDLWEEFITMASRK